MASLPTVVWSQVQQRGRAFFRTSFPGFPHGLKQFFGQVSRAVAINVWSGLKRLEALDLDIIPQPNSSSAILSAWAWLLGLPDGAGGYGRLVATAASGGVGSLTGQAGTSFPNGLIATAEDGTTQIQLSGTVAIPGSSGLGSIPGNFVAVTKGSIGNLSAGAVMSWQSPPLGADPSFVLTSALSGAIDLETNAAVYARIVQRLQNPPRGGNDTDYQEWAEEQSGIQRVYVYPKRSGTGTVDLVITQGGSGTARVPTAATQTATQAKVDAERPAAADASNVLVPQTFNGHLIRVRVVPTSANPFDWGADAPGTAYTVDASGYVAGPPATITLTGVAPTSLTQAVDAFLAGTGQKPRIQVLSTGAPAINPPIGVVAYTTVAGPKTKLTLESVPATWTPPSNGDTIYPYGNLVGTIAPLLLAYVDGLGPSRVSGFADPFDDWSDTIAINQLVAVAENAVDGAGKVLISKVPVGGATIDGLAVDVQAADATVGAPEMLYASHIAVTQ